eukprot:3681174-Prymnesium_polylepis.2
MNLAVSASWNSLRETEPEPSCARKPVACHEREVSGAVEPILTSAECPHLVHLGEQIHGRH